jgi:hypothetical protein
MERFGKIFLGLSQLAGERISLEGGIPPAQ